MCDSLTTLTYLGMDMACYRAAWATAGSRRDFSLPKEPLISNAGLGERELDGWRTALSHRPARRREPAMVPPCACSWALRAFAMVPFTREARTNQEGTE